MRIIKQCFRILNKAQDTENNFPFDDNNLIDTVYRSDGNNVHHLPF